jgi:hypothetical protein
MPKSKALSIILPEVNPERIAAILIAYGAMESVHLRLKLLFAAAQGACLVALQEQHGFTRGHHGTAAKTATCGFSSWEDFIEKKFGFSDDKARRLMNRWRAVAPLIDKLAPEDRLRVADFLGRPMLHLTPDKIKPLEKITNRIATLQDEIDDLAERKFIKQKRHIPVNHKPELNGGDRKETTPELMIQDELFGPIDKLCEWWNKPLKVGKKEEPLWAHVPRAQLAIYVGKIEDMLAEAKEALKKK